MKLGDIIAFLRNSRRIFRDSRFKTPDSIFELGKLKVNIGNKQSGESCEPYTDNVMSSFIQNDTKETNMK